MTALEENDSDYDSMFGDCDDGNDIDDGNCHGNDNGNANANDNDNDSNVSESSDFDDMFGESDEEAPPIDIHRTSIPRKRKLGATGNANARTSSTSRSSPSSSSKKTSRRKRAAPTSAAVDGGGGQMVLERRRPDQYKQFDMDDFWRSLRSWDCVTELNTNMKRNSHVNKGQGEQKKKHPNDSSDSEDEQQPSEKEHAQPLPDEFHCYEQYIALWAPLQMKETKAQILSDISSSNRTVSFQKLTVPIQATPQKASTDSYTECLSLQIASRTPAKAYASSKNANKRAAGMENSNGGGGGQNDFAQNDLVLITCDASIVEQASKGILRPPDKSSYSISSLLSLASPFVEGRLAIVGVVAHRCKSLDGLVVQVSRRLWKPSSMGVCDLFLLRLGSNVTGESI